MREQDHQGTVGRIALGAVIAAFGALAIPATALAGSVDATGTAITFTADPGEFNNVRVSSGAGDTYTVTIG